MPVDQATCYLLWVQFGFSALNIEMFQPALTLYFINGYESGIS